MSAGSRPCGSMAMQILTTLRARLHASCFLRQGLLRRSLQLANEVDQRAKTPGNVAPTGIIEAEPRKRRCPVGEHLDQPPRRHVRSSPPRREVRQSEAGQRGFMHEI